MLRDPSKAMAAPGLLFHAARWRKGWR